MIISLWDTFSLKSLESLLENSSVKSVGLLSGVWDLTHYYHVLTLWQAKRLCDILVVGVGSDRLVRNDKGLDRPIYPEYQRIGVIDSLKPVDVCFIMDHEKDYGTAANFLNRAKPNSLIHFKNETWIERRQIIPGWSKDDEYVKDIYDPKEVEHYGNLVILRDTSNESSTTSIIGKIRAC